MSPIATHGAFLRGMNLGRHRRVTNTELQSALTQLGFGDVGTFRASGNVVFGAGEESDEALEQRIEAGLERALGYPVPAYVRSAREIRAIAVRAPFDAASVRASTGKLHVALLRAAPAPAARRQALAHATGRDELALAGRELYWLPRGRTIESDIDLRALERLLGAWTMRTKATIEELAARHLPG